MPVNDLIDYLTSFPTMTLFPREERSEVLRAVYVCILRAAKDGANTICIGTTQIAWYKADLELGRFPRTSALMPIPEDSYRTVMRRILELDRTASEYLFVTSDTNDTLTLTIDSSSASFQSPI